MDLAWPGRGRRRLESGVAQIAGALGKPYGSTPASVAQIDLKRAESARTEVAHVTPAIDASGRQSVILMVASGDHDASLVRTLVSAHRRINRDNDSLNLDPLANSRQAACVELIQIPKGSWRVAQEFGVQLLSA